MTGAGEGKLPALAGTGGGEADADDRNAGGRSAPGERPPVPPEVRARAGALVVRFGLDEIDAEILGRDPAVADFYRASVEAWPSGEADAEAAAAIANWIINDLPPVQGSRSLEQLPFGPGELAELVSLVADDTISTRGGSEVLEVLARDGGAPAAIVEALDLVQVSDESALRPVIESVVAANPDKVAAYRNGKTGLLGFFMGQVMRETGGKADPERARALLEGALE